MTDISVLDRVQARLDYQAQRIDVLYAVLEERGLLPLQVDGDNAVLDELVQIEDSPLASEHGRVLLHVGTATGV